MEFKSTNLPQTIRGIHWLTAIIALGINAYLLIQFFQGRWNFFSLVRVTYAFDTIMLPLALIAVGTGTLFALRHHGEDVRRLRLVSCGWLIVAFLLILSRVWATHIEPRLLQVRRVAFTSSKLSRPLRILHMSDVQSASVGNYEKKAFAAAQNLSPDLILFTGDMIQSVPGENHPRDIAAIAQLWSEMAAPLGIYGVFGDVDSPRETGPAIPAIHWLHDEGATIEFEGSRINLYGLTLYQSRNHSEEIRSVIPKWLDSAAPDDFNILLGHAPDFALVAQDYPVDLCLAGHTHGGQIRIPFYGPLVLLSDIPKDWGKGFRTIRKSRLNVSAGIGGEHAANLPTIRVNCLPEMTLIEITPE